ncbi:DUF4158 domain-containing protein [Methylomonas sp. ZR1]|uniref:DUF4158 domain-containing protein n=1 Tax=Methylomonas sp. ZR1 TaxID=1797072 RepID=UPI001492B6A4|nr:DUF4158 domain-containing protein [Methylomonas sp. ZR1]NOV29576.1 DUF4158 domain-containing protein [Methylomonas sp. ZR1]
MTLIHETAYPRLKADPTPHDLQNVYSLTTEEITFIDQIAKRPAARTIAFLYLKLFQRLGYFVKISDIPTLIRQYIITQAGYQRPPRLEELKQFDKSSSRNKLIADLRRFLNVRPLDVQGQAWLGHIAETAADNRHVPVVARRLQTSADHEFAGNPVVEQIVQLIEQRAALTVRRFAGFD